MKPNFKKVYNCFLNCAIIYYVKVIFINPKGRIPRVYPWMNGNSSKGRRAWLEMWKGATSFPVGFPLIKLII